MGKSLALQSKASANSAALRIKTSSNHAALRNSYSAKSAATPIKTSANHAALRIKTLSNHAVTPKHFPIGGGFFPYTPKQKKFPGKFSGILWNYLFLISLFDKFLKQLKRCLYEVLLKLPCSHCSELVVFGDRSNTRLDEHPFS